jgi:hypothetical protein
MYRQAGEGSKVLRDMRKGKDAAKTKKLNVSRSVSHAGQVMSHVAQGILKNSRKVRKDHVIWQPDNDREENRHQKDHPTLQYGGAFTGYGA